MRVVVVGAGVFGTWTAHHLLEAGAEVTLVDQYGPGNSRSSSGDETRILRCGYGPDAVYSALARESRDKWRALEARASAAEPLWHPCGVLWLADGQDAYTQATLATLRHERHAVDVLDAAALRRRFPELQADGIDTALFEPEAGVLSARRAVGVLAAELRRRGARLLHAHVTRFDPPDAVIAGDGTRIRADRIVFACGAWLPRVLPDLLGGRIRPTRQTVVYFGVPAGDARFGPDALPAWVDFPAGIYGTPDIGGRGVKVGIDAHGPLMDPDADDRVPDAASMARAREWLARRIPALSSAPVVETRVCQYENSATGDFLIDRHPLHPNVVIVGGGSGHGFKHGPAVGALAARLVLTGAATHERFALAARVADAGRIVY